MGRGPCAGEAVPYACQRPLFARKARWLANVKPTKWSDPDGCGEGKGRGPWPSMVHEFASLRTVARRRLARGPRPWPLTSAFGLLVADEYIATISIPYIAARLTPDLFGITRPRASDSMERRGAMANVRRRETRPQSKRGPGIAVWLGGQIAPYRAPIMSLGRLMTFINRSGYDHSAPSG